MGKDSAARIEFRSFHQRGTVNEKVCESDFSIQKQTSTVSLNLVLIHFKSD